MGNCLTNTPKIHKSYKHVPKHRLIRDFEPQDDIKVSVGELTTVLCQYEILFPNATPKDPKIFKQLKEEASKGVKNLKFLFQGGNYHSFLNPQEDRLSLYNDIWLLKFLNTRKIFKNTIKMEDTAFYFFKYSEIFGQEERDQDFYENSPIQYYITCLLADIDQDIFKIFKEETDVNEYVEKCHVSDLRMAELHLTDKHQESAQDNKLSKVQIKEKYFEKRVVLRHLYFRERMESVFSTLNEEMGEELLNVLVYQNSEKTKNIMRWYLTSQ